MVIEMKIEKVNDNQIRCTLTREDLANRELKISELAYGTEKAKTLFRDMMQQAASQFGFEAEDIPLMIEAIPLNSECIVLIITKVEDPEELDTRFSKFAPSLHDGDEEGEDAFPESSEGTDDVLDLFKRIHESRLAQQAADDTSAATKAVPRQQTNTTDVIRTDAPEVLARTFLFASLHEAVRAAHLLENYYEGENSIYKDIHNSCYILMLSKSSHTPEEFNRICNLLSEYGTPVKSVPAAESYLEEHSKPLIRDHALQSLAQI